METKASGGAGDGTVAQESSVTIASLERRHLASLAEAHATCFPGYFLTNMGPWFVRLYYEAYLDYPEAAVVVAVDGDDRVIAFAAGTADVTRHDAFLMRTHPAALLWAATKAAVTNGTVRRQLFQGFRVTRLANMLSRARRKVDTPVTAPAGPGSPSGPSMTLTSVGVLPECRGSGLSMTMIEAFEREARRMGMRRVRTSTALDNPRAQAFYEKAGWVVASVREKDNGIDFEHVLAD